MKKLKTIALLPVGGGSRVVRDRCLDLLRAERVVFEIKLLGLWCARAQRQVAAVAAAIVAVVAAPIASAAAQGSPQSGTYSVTTPDPAQGPAYGGPASGGFIYAPKGTKLTVVVDPPVLPGGPGTAPDQSGELNGWNGSQSSLSGSNDSTTQTSANSKSFAKLQTVKVSVDTPAPHERRWECQGSAKVGGVVKAILTDAHGTCHAAGKSKTQVVYAGAKVTAEDQEAIALAHQGSGNVGVTIWVLGVQVTYDAAGSSDSQKALADSDVGSQLPATSAVIDYVQKGDMAHSIQAAIDGATAKAETQVEAKGSAVVTFVLVTAI